MCWGTMTKRLIDVDDDALDRAKAKLGTRTTNDTVNEALRTAARERHAEFAGALATLRRQTWTMRVGANCRAHRSSRGEAKAAR